MSKRSGNFVALDELIDEIGPDATRLLSLMSSIDQATTARSRASSAAQSMENPVYYVQYAHARISSIGRVAAERGIERLADRRGRPALLAIQRELELLRCLEELPDVIAEAARDAPPTR